MAATTSDEKNKCAMLCELHIMEKRGKKCSAEEWEKQARRQGWLKDGGMPLYNIGRMLEQECFSTRRTFHNTFEDIKAALAEGAYVIVIVDKNELTGKLSTIIQENEIDRLYGSNPNHAIVVEAYDEQFSQVRYYDPDSELPFEQTIAASQFLDAWTDSMRFMVKVTERSLANYVPHPIDLSDVDLQDDIEELTEAIAENAHEVWAAQRKEEGWTYGLERNDQLKQTPDMVPYSDLPEKEKDYDRRMAIDTIKLMRKLGYEIKKY